MIKKTPSTPPLYFTGFGSPLQIEEFERLVVGQEYLTAETPKEPTRRVTIEEYDEEDEHGYCFRSDDQDWYSADGQYVIEKDHYLDLRYRVVQKDEAHYVEYGSVHDGACTSEHCDPEIGNECKACYDANLYRNLTKAQYVEFVKGTFESMSTLIAQKNSDYTAGVDDPFANFRISEEIGINPISGLFLRMQDKAQRIKAWIKAGSLEVPGEGIEDAFRDFIGYSCLALGMLHEASQRSSDCTIPTTSPAEGCHILTPVKTPEPTTAELLDNWDYSNSDRIQR